MSPDQITTGAYNQSIDKRLARKLLWLRDTGMLYEFNELLGTRYCQTDEL